MITKKLEAVSSIYKKESQDQKPEIYNLDMLAMINMIKVASQLVETSRDYLNKINVFPVADGDTGSNMSYTLKALEKQISDQTFESVDTFLNFISTTAITKSRGNSGTLLASFISGFALELCNQSQIDAKSLARAFESGYKKSHDSVLEPQKGTILDVLEVFSSEFSRLVKTESDIYKIFTIALDQAKTALEKTRNILPQSKKAKVVDSGAAGVYLVLEGFKQGLIQSLNHTPIQDQVLDQTDLGDTSQLEGEIQDLTFPFCLEFLIEDSLSPDEPFDFKLVFQELGDSLQVVHAKNTIKLHIHTDNPDQIKSILAPRFRLLDSKIDDMSKMQKDWIKSRHATLSSLVTQNLNFDDHPKNDGLKSKLLVITDSSADLPADFLEKYPIWRLGIPVYTDDDPDRDWQKQLKHEDFYTKMMTEIGFAPKTSKVNQEIFEQAFQRALDIAENILVLPISSGVSATFESAIKAKEKFLNDRIKVLDSQTTSAGLGLKIKHVFEKLADGQDIDSIINSLIHLRSKVKFYFSVESVQYLEKSGRISTKQSKFAQLFKISPLLMLKNGKIENSRQKVWFANNKKIVDLLHKKVDSHHKNQPIKDMFIVYAGASGLEKVQILIDKLKKETGYEVDANQVLPLTQVVGTHVGPGTVGVIFK